MPLPTPKDIPEFVTPANAYVRDSQHQIIHLEIMLERVLAGIGGGGGGGTSIDYEGENVPFILTQDGPAGTAGTPIFKNTKSQDGVETVTYTNILGGALPATPGVNDIGFASQVVVPPLRVIPSIAVGAGLRTIAAGFYALTIIRESGTGDWNFQGQNYNQNQGVVLPAMAQGLTYDSVNFDPLTLDMRVLEVRP